MLRKCISFSILQLYAGFGFKFIKWVKLLNNSPTFYVKIMDGSPGKE